MRTGGLLNIARAFVADSIRSIGVAVSAGCAAVADRIEPPREWDPRRWDRGQDPRSDNRERRP